MIQAALAGLILIAIYKFINEPDGDLVDWWTTFMFVLVPGFLLFLTSFLLIYLEINLVFLLFGYALYYFTPYLWLRHYVEFSKKSAFKFAIWVPVVAIVTEILICLLYTSPSPRDQRGSRMPSSA